MAATSPRPKTESQRAFHARMRAQGLKPVTVWVPDPASPAFAAEAARQSRAIADSPSEAEDQAFVDSISEFWNDEFWAET